MMVISNDEQQAIRQVLAMGERFGYGNLIAHLQTAWARSLMEDWSLSEEAARAASGGGYPFAMQADLMERGEWDETGKSYQRKPKGATGRCWYCGGVGEHTGACPSYDEVAGGNE